jgi:hypothetical protein
MSVVNELQLQLNVASIEVITAVTVQIAVFSRRLVTRYGSLGEKCCLHLQGLCVQR